jgi:uncharacterized protein
VSQPKIVIDTNVLVSAVLKRGSLEEPVVLLVADKRCELLISHDICAEYDRVLRRPRLKLAPERIDFFLRLILKESSLVTNTVRLSISPDEPDNRFLECAEAAKADFIVTGDKRHFPKVWKTTRIVSARELLEMLKSP